MGFPDSNVWLYAFLPPVGDPKRERAISIIARDDLVVSPNVINEVSRSCFAKAEFPRTSFNPSSVNSTFAARSSLSMKLT